MARNILRVRELKLRLAECVELPVGGRALDIWERGSGGEGGDTPFAR